MCHLSAGDTICPHGMVEEMGTPSACNDPMRVHVPLSGEDETTHLRVFSNLLSGGNHSVFPPSASFPNAEFSFSTSVGYPPCCGDCSRFWGYCNERNRQILVPKELTFQWGRWGVNKYIIC